VPTEPTISPEINDWIDVAVSNMKGKGTPGTVSRLISEGEAKRQAPNVSDLEKARLYLTTSGLRMELVQAGKDRRVNATQGFRDLQSAVRLAPDDLIVDRAFGQTLYGMNNVGFMLKKLTELGLGIKLGDETKRAIQLLGAHPQDAEAQVGRQLLARLCGDSAAANAATHALSTLPADDVAKARAAYDDAKSTAKTAKTDE
jgi:hypothetical protein